MKLIALRQHYFKKAWNVFDFIIVISSLIGKEAIKLYVVRTDLSP